MTVLRRFEWRAALAVGVLGGAGVLLGLVPGVAWAALLAVWAGVLLPLARHVPRGAAVALAVGGTALLGGAVGLLVGLPRELIDAFPYYGPELLLRPADWEQPWFHHLERQGAGDAVRGLLLGGGLGAVLGGLGARATGERRPVPVASAGVGVLVVLGFVALSEALLHADPFLRVGCSSGCWVIPRSPVSRLAGAWLVVVLGASAGALLGGGGARRTGWGLGLLAVAGFGLFQGYLVLVSVYEPHFEVRWFGVPVSTWPYEGGLGEVEILEADPDAVVVVDRAGGTHRLGLVVGLWRWPATEVARAVEEGILEHNTAGRPILSPEGGPP